MSPTDRERAFNDATKLLYAAFPKRSIVAGQYYDVWVACQQYIQHLLSLKDNFKAAEKTISLKPIKEFSLLLTDGARWVYV